MEAVKYKHEFTDVGYVCYILLGVK